MTAVEGTAGSGRVTLALDFRTEDRTPAGRSAYWNRIEDIALLVTLLSDLCGPDTSVFFDFGVVTIKNVDLAVLADRIKTASPDP